MKTKKIYIQGMHCPSCEKLLEGEFKNIPGVRNVKVDRKIDSAEIFFDDKEPDFEEIKNMAEKFGYTAHENEPVSKNSDTKNKTSLADWLKAGLIIVAILFVFHFFQASGLANGIGASNKSISYGVAFLVGLVASVSSCLAVVGAVVIAFSEKYHPAHYPAERDSGAGKKRNFFNDTIKPNLFFHIGRLGTFFILGGLLGAVGGELNISGNFVSIYTIIIALVMAWLGLNILGLVPSLSAVGIKMPKKFSARWEGLKKSEHMAAPFVLGGLTFFLPCGFTQSMQLFALASGSFLVGGLSLFLFALGTLPTLLVLGITASWTKNRGLAVFQKVAGVLIILFAVYTFNSGLALSGVKTNVISSAGNKQTSETKNDASQPQAQPAGQASQTVTMNVTASGFEPSVFTVKQGVLVKWVINGVNVTGCTSTVIVPSYNISKNLKLGENVVQFTPQSKGIINFSCGMGMVRGKFVVE
ncbi:MAG: sulfite exporter TauE/SafE family protein [Candidatus Moranbacteria bacterium]|nr:sulfite exporter TauE/SafE family protein [Candidatus Moranbacteria bacterium]